ncbi:MAG: hypothetical protein KDI55_03155, partial [Anaerolineae bacterium]|nr:hypothetical protein [Anaerolineae bacterium]
MTAVVPQNDREAKASTPAPLLPRLLRFVLLIVGDIVLIWILARMVSLGYLPLAAALLAIGIFVNVVMVRREAYPIRWMVVGLVLMALFTIYPIFFTVWVSFTNYGEGHLITQEQAIQQILKAKYLPE